MLPEDTGEAALIRPLLAQTFLETTPLQLIYNADEHGWSAAMFHKRVNTYGAAVVIAETEGGAVIGGYNPDGWIGLGEDRDSNAAFLFTWPDGNTAAARPVKLPKAGGASQAVLDRPGAGPIFGPDGLRVPMEPADPKRVRALLSLRLCSTSTASLPAGFCALRPECHSIGRHVHMLSMLCSGIGL